MQKYVSEFLGTFILLLSIVGSGIAGQQYTDDQMVILFSHAVVIGFTLIFLIRIFANYSGAHFNPIVSLLFFFKGELSSKDLVIYIVIQCVAATFGTMFANFLFGLNIIEISSSNIFDQKLPLKKIDKISENGIIYSFKEKEKFSNLPSVFLKEIWKPDINDTSEIFNSEKDTYVLLNVLEENPENIPPYEKINKLVYKDWLENEIIIKSKENAEKLMLNKNFKFTNNGSIKRNSKKLNKIEDAYLINQIFEIKGNVISYIYSKNKVFAVKILKSRIDDYEYKKDLYDQINSSFSKSYFNDFANYYINHLSSKHNLKRNYNELEKLLKSSE